MNSIIDRPNCPLCKKPMRLIATGKYSKTFFCMDCSEKLSIDREEPDDSITAAFEYSEE